MANENERFTTMTYPPEAQFQRLLAAAYQSPEELDWIEVMDPESDFGGAQVGEVIAWECDADISSFSRGAARGGGGARAMQIMGLFVQGGMAGFKLGGETIDPQQAAKLKAMTDAARELLDGMNINRVVVGRDSGTEWCVFGQLYSDHLQVDDIADERAIIVGKIKGIVRRGERRKLVNTDAMRFMQTLNSTILTAPTAPDNEIDGPALELDILAIYR
jgi:hypothetical protein